MRPRAAMPVLKRRAPVINSAGPPPWKITAPVSPSKAWRRWSPSEPMPQTMAWFAPSVEVTKGEIDDGRAGDAERIDVAAREARARHGRAHVALPDERSVGGFEGIDAVGFGDGNHHGPAIWTAFEIERLRVDVPGDGAVKIRVAVQVGGGGRSKVKIDVKAITGRVIVVLGDIDSRANRERAEPDVCEERRDTDPQCAH